MVMISVLVLLGLGLVTATVLAVASRVFHVEEDPRVQAVLEALGLEPEAVRTAPLPDALAEGAWDQTALELAWEWGLLPEDAGSAAEIARVQGGAMADAFAALL